MSWLVVVAVPAEADAVLSRLGPAGAVRLGPLPGRRAGEVTVVAGGIGAAAAASATAAAMALAAYDWVVSMGVAGGFAGRARMGDVVVADAIVPADLGAEQADGSFRSLAELGLDRVGPALPVPEHREPVARLRAAGLPCTVGPVLTVGTVTGTADRAEALAGRYAPVAEAMEGYGVQLGARGHPARFAEVRTVSNLVGPRDQAGWDLAGALDRLGAVAAALLGTP